MPTEREVYLKMCQPCANRGTIITFYYSPNQAQLFTNCWFSSGSIVSDYGLDDRAIGVQSPAGGRNFPLASVSRLALGPTQLPVQWVPGVLSPAEKRGRGVTLTTHSHLVPRSRMSRSYTPSPPKRLQGV
jgi:hypothetical protein